MVAEGDALFDLAGAVTDLAGPASSFQPSPAGPGGRGRAAGLGAGGPAAPGAPVAGVLGERGAVVPVAPEGGGGGAPVEGPAVGGGTAGAEAGLQVPGQARFRAAVIPVDPGAVPGGPLVAPGVREAPLLAIVRAGLPVCRKLRRRPGQGQTEVKVVVGGGGGVGQAPHGDQGRQGGEERDGAGPGHIAQAIVEPNQRDVRTPCVRRELPGGSPRRYRVSDPGDHCPIKWNVKSLGSRFEFAGTRFISAGSGSPVSLNKEPAVSNACPAPADRVSLGSRASSVNTAQTKMIMIP